jgi:hypothetical protein
MGQSRRFDRTPARLAVYPDERTFPVPACLSEKCEKRKSLLHSITSPATVGVVGGTSKRSAFVALRWMTTSNLVGCITGKPAASAPLRILPV